MESWLLDCHLLKSAKKDIQFYEFTHYDYGVWTSSIVWFQDRDKFISHKGNKSLPVDGPCSCTTELNALLAWSNNGRYPRAPRSWNWSLNSPSSWTSPVVPYNSPVLQLNAITLMIPTWFSWFLKLTTPFDNVLLKISKHFSYWGALNALLHLRNYLQIQPRRWIAFPRKWRWKCFP